jgi:RNA polymerase sigma-70 factor, ECF subfamily
MLTFEEVYESEKGHVLSVCLRLLKDPFLAEDASQETFLNIWKKLSFFRGESALSTWVHRVAVNHSLMLLRRLRRDKFLTPLDALNLRTPPHEAPNIQLEQAIMNLPTGYRHCVILHDILGYAHPEVARMLGITIGAVKSQKHKAIKALRRSLQVRAA